MVRAAHHVASPFVVACACTSASYRANNVVLRARKSTGGFTVTGTYERTLVWSPPDNTLIAGSRTAEYGVQLFFTREGGLELRRDEELRELRTSPAR